jgi:hypothetical protein
VTSDHVIKVINFKANLYKIESEEKKLSIGDSVSNSSASPIKKKDESSEGDITIRSTVI